MTRPPNAPTWYEVTSIPRALRPQLDFTAEADVCVVGGGLAGLHVARELQRRGWSVVLLEAARIAEGASGRNGGFVIDGFAQNILAIENRLGLDHARALHALSREGMALVRRTIVETRMPGVAPVAGSLRVTRHAQGIGTMRAEAEHLARFYGHGAEFWPQERVREVLRTPRYSAGLHDAGAFHIHPLNYCLGLAEEAARLGVRIYEATPAMALDLTSVRRAVRTPKGLVRCDRIVLCGSASLPSSLSPRAAGAIVPVSTFIGVTEPLGDALAEAIAFPGAVSDTRRAGNYFRVLEGGRLLWGSGITAWNTPPRRLARRMAADLARSFPKLRASRMEFAWSGVMGYAAHKMPQIREIARGVWVSSAFGGHGLNTTAAAGLVIARAIAEGDDSYRLFAPFGLDRTFGILGRIAAQLEYWRLQAQDIRDEWRR
jgi:gamma-glutamylputrescine oxidase